MRALRFAGVIAAWLLLGIAAALAQTAEEIGNLQRQAGQLFNERKYAEALTAQRTVVAGMEKMEPARPGVGNEMAQALNSLAWYALFASGPAEALRASARAHKLDPDSIVIDTNRAHALLFLRRTNDARKLYLAHKGKRIEPDSDKTWEDVIAEDFDALRAAGIMHKAFPRIVEELGVKSPALNAKIEATRKEVNRLYSAGQYGVAAAAAETLVDLTSRRFGEGRSEFAQAIEWLALSKQRLGQTAEAEPLLKRSLAIREKALGPDHLEVAESLNGLAELYRTQERYAEVEPLYQRSLAIYEKALGPNHHPLVGASLNNLAALYREQGRHAEAEPIYRRILAIYENGLGPDHPLVGTTLSNLAFLYLKQGRHAEAEPLYQRSLAIREKALGPNHPDVAESLDSLAALYRGLRRYAEAEPLYERSLAIREKALGPNLRDVGIQFNKLAQLYQDQGRYDEAEPLYKRALAIRQEAFGPDHRDVAESLNNLGALYRALQRYGEAEPLYQRSLAIYEKALGPDHLDVGTSLNDLAGLYRARGRYADAEPIYKRSLAIREKASGPDHLDVAESLNDLAELYRAQERYAEAEPLYQRSLAIRKKALGPNHRDVAESLTNLAMLYQAQRRYAEADPLYKRSLAIRERALGPNHPDETSLLNLASVYGDLRWYAEAEPIYKRSLAIREKVLGPDHREVGTFLVNLAALYFRLARYAEAEPLYQRSLAIYEKALGPNHCDVGTTLSNLAFLYLEQRRYAEAEPIYKRALAILEKALGQDHLDVGTTLKGLAAVYHGQGRYAEAEPLYERALAIYKKALGPDHRDVGTLVGALAVVYQDQGRYAEAERLHKRSLAILEKALGPDHPDVGRSIHGLATVYHGEGRYAEAEPLYERALAIYRKALGHDHPDVGRTLNDLAMLYVAQRNWARAADFLRHSTSIVVWHTLRGSDDVGEALTGKRKDEAEQESHRFLNLVKVVHHLAAQDRGAEDNFAREMFQAAQWARGSAAAASVAQMAARGAKGNPTLAALVRERQDLVGEWQRRVSERSAAAAQAPDERDRAAEAANVAKLAAIDARIGKIDKTLLETFPNYAAFARPTPLSVEEIQAELRADERLVLFLDTPDSQLPEETFIWVVTKTDVRWVRSKLGTAALQREVAALRCGLDAQGAWDAPDTTCPSLFNGNYSDQDRRRGKPLPFDAVRAHALYKGLFGEVKDLIKDKHLIVVPSGPLSQLPFQVLVTHPPDKNPTTYDDYRSIAWLPRSHPVTVLPAVSSLKALRRNAQSSQATKPFLGIGNPLLDGSDQSYVSLRQAALARTKCGGLAPIEVGEAISHRGVTAITVRGGIADVAQLKRADPLPETADELCDVARMLGAAESDVLLGARSVEPEIVRMSEAGRLRDYQVLHFATHGALAGEATGSTEPGLLLTPPAQGSEADDGYLSASEIARLKLDADWVILSACNTAAGGAKGAEALSGLARAFFYAGARALLVSHWNVNSDATVALIKGAFEELNAAPKIGRAEALRRSMLALIDKGRGRFTHPAIWAPFVVVGEGGADK